MSAADSAPLHARLLATRHVTLPLAIGPIFAQTGVRSHSAVTSSVAVGALATAVLVVNNLRDRDCDVCVGKRMWRLLHTDGAALNRHLGATAQLALVFNALLGLGAWL